MCHLRKNSDRPEGEKEKIARYAAATHDPGAMLQCTYISIPQTINTHSVLLSQIEWMWGCENGANEHGGVIGNEAEENEKLLLGLDLVRLGLERGETSREALDAITALLEEFGQGGPCAQEDPTFTYHNSFLIADYNESWILETAGRPWVAQRWTEGGRNISNGLTIRTEFDASSAGIEEYSIKNLFWDGKGPFDFAAIFSEGGVDELSSLTSRQGCGETMLSKHDGSGKFNREDMIVILRDHGSGICMHGSFDTTASMVSELYPDRKANHWMTGEPYPCTSPFKLQRLIGEDDGAAIGATVLDAT